MTQHSRHARTLVAIAAWAMLAGAPGPAAAAPFYEGKTVTIVVGYPPGGGYDRVARVVANHLSKHIPGRPVVVVQNMPGANSIIAANHLYNIARPDGLTIGTFNRNLPLGQLIRAEGVKFDMTKFAWIGSASSEVTVLTIRSDLPYNSFEDLRKAKEPVIIGATGPGASTHDFPLLLKEYLGANLKVLSGYKSSSEIMLAIERKEVDGRAGSYASVKPWVDRGVVKPLIRTRATEPGIEQLPVDEELAPSKLAKAVFALRSIPELIGRPYVAPPGTPDELVQTLREAFARLARDPEAVEEAKKLKFSLEYVPGDQAARIVREIFEQPEEVVREFTRHVKFGD